MKGRAAPRKGSNRSKMKLIMSIVVFAIALIFALVSRYGNRISWSGAGNASEWSLRAYPDYIRILGDAEVDKELDVGEISYSELDDLGRAGPVYAVITADEAKAGAERDREDMSRLFPSGWTNNREVDIRLSNGDVYHGYFYNRSHLLAKSLGGDEIIENIVTGTRMQNVGNNDGKGGMGYPETLARDWLAAHPDGWIYYSAIPVYEGDEKLCRSVIVNVLSSDGTLDFCVEVFNAANGYEIDYASGEYYAIAS